METSPPRHNSNRARHCLGGLDARTALQQGRTMLILFGHGVPFDTILTFLALRWCLSVSRHGEGGEGSRSQQRGKGIVSEYDTYA
jgi:hypothetical protein